MMTRGRSPGRRATASSCASSQRTSTRSGRASPTAWAYFRSAWSAMHLMPAAARRRARFGMDRGLLRHRMQSVRPSRPLHAILRPRAGISHRSRDRRRRHQRGLGAAQLARTIARVAADPEGTGEISAEAFEAAAALDGLGRLVALAAVLNLIVAPVPLFLVALARYELAAGPGRAGSCSTRTWTGMASRKWSRQSMAPGTE